MAAAPDNGILRPPGSPPLGAILVKRGLLTEEQLAAALAESHRTGEPTGEVIVRLGFANAATIAQALATQHGGPLKTEYGYAVGFGSSTPSAPVGPPPVSPVPAQDERPAAPAPASAVRATPPVEPALAPAPASAAAPAAPAGAPAEAPAQPDPFAVARQWQQHAQQVTVQRDAAQKETEAAKARVAELEAARAGESDLELRNAELERQLAKLRESAAADESNLAAATTRLVELEAAGSDEDDRQLELAAAREEAASLHTEKAVLQRARAEAESRTAELERQLAELRESAAADDGHLAAATARLAELESAASRDAELEAKLADARDEAARFQMEKVALEAAHESMAAHTADLEERVKQLEAANAHTARLEQQLEEATAQIAHLEAERADVLKVAKVLGEERRHHDHADDPAHLLFAPGGEGYRLVEREGPPPAPGSTLELPGDDGTALTLTVTKIGASPLPGTRLACAYLVSA